MAWKHPGNDTHVAGVKLIDEAAETGGLDDIGRRAVVRGLDPDDVDASPRDPLRRQLRGSVEGGVVDVDPGPEASEHGGVGSRRRPGGDRRNQRRCGKAAEDDQSGQARHAVSLGPVGEESVIIRFGRCRA